MNKPWRVVNIGGGFGGLLAAQSLKSQLVDVTLIDRRNYHLFQPLLYQVATGSLSPGEIAARLCGVLGRRKTARVLLVTVADVDAESKRVLLKDGAVVPYDALVVAVGSQTPYFGHKKWQRWARGLKSIEEAITTHVMYLIKFQSRIVVLIQWAIQDLTFTRGARPITGSAPTDFNCEHAVSQQRSIAEVRPAPVSLAGGR